MRYALAALVLGLAATVPADARVGGLSGVWLVAGQMRDEVRGRGLFKSDKTVIAAKQCGLTLKPVAAFHFDEVATGLTVIGTGPYARDEDAAADLKQLQRCVPAAYLTRLTFYPE